jgi:hypothetical protein
MQTFERSHVAFTGSGGCQIESIGAFLIREILNMPQQQDFSIRFIHRTDQRMNPLLRFLSDQLGCRPGHRS